MAVPITLTTGQVYVVGWSGTVSGASLTLSGTAKVSQTALGTTSTDGFVAENTTAATGGTTVQISPRFRLRGTAWDTSASETVDFFLENLPATAATPTGTFKIGYSLNGAAATYPLTLTSAGVLASASTGIVLQGGGTSSSFPAWKRTGAGWVARLADDSANTFTQASSVQASGNFANSAGPIIWSFTAPTISSGFGTSPSIVANNGTFAFTINVGTGGTAQNGVIGLPTATTGWLVTVNNITNPASSVVAQTAVSTTSATIQNYARTTGLAAAWTASDVLQVKAMAY